MPFQKGNKLGGRLQIEKPARDALLKALMRPADDKAKGKTKLDKIAAAHVSKCIDGDVPAIKEFYDRIDGKVPQGIGGDDTLPPINVFQNIGLIGVTAKRPAS